MQFDQRTLQVAGAAERQAIDRAQVGIDATTRGPELEGRHSSARRMDRFAIAPGAEKPQYLLHGAINEEIG